MAGVLFARILPAVLLVTAAITRIGDTNAKRFAMGLPPLRPKSLFDASPVDTARKAKRSVTMAPPNTQYSCYSTYQPECCNNEIINPDGSVSFTGCTATSTGGQPFTCADAQYAMCQNPGYQPFFAETTHTYHCNAPYSQVACCDPTNTNFCVDATFLGQGTTSAFYCPNTAIDDNLRFPNCCTDDTFETCANLAIAN